MSEAPHDGPRLPLISVVFLTKNAGPGLHRTLEQIRSQEIEGPVEIVAVDSGSVDGTVDLLRSFGAHVHCIPPEEFNFGRTRGLAFSLARGEYIVTISQDVAPTDSQWLRQMTGPFSGAENVVAVQGSTKVPSDTNVFFWERQGHYYYTGEATLFKAKYGTNLSFTNCAIRRSFADRHLLGEVPFAEDKVFQTMIAEAGMKVVAAPEACVLHGHQYSLRTLFRRLLGEGFGLRSVALEYTLRHCLRDLVRERWVFRVWLAALFRGELRNPAEMVFPFVRPFCIFWGSRLLKHW